MDSGRLLLGCGSPSELTHDSSDLLRQGAHTALTGVLLDDEVESTRGEVDILHLEPVLLGFLGYEVLLSDLQLLLCNVARDFDELHTVTQGGGDGGDIIRRSDEEDLERS